MPMNGTIGLIGFGRIARGVVERLARWGVHFLVFDLAWHGEQGVRLTVF